MQLKLAKVVTSGKIKSIADYCPPSSHGSPGIENAFVDFELLPETLVWLDATPLRPDVLHRLLEIHFHLLHDEGYHLQVKNACGLSMEYVDDVWQADDMFIIHTVL